MNSKFSIETSRPAPLYLQVKQNILQLIERGQLKDGDRLPSETEIASICRLSRGTVRTALSELSREGLISRTPRLGSFLTLEKPRSIVRIGILSTLFSAQDNPSSDFFQMELVGGVRDGAMQQEAVLIFLTNTAEGESLVNEGINAVLFLVPRKSDIARIREIERQGIPCLSLSAAVGDEFSYVAADNFGGSYKAMEHLFLLGHRSIGFIAATLEDFDAQERFRGYCSFLEERGIPLDESIVEILGEADSSRWHAASADAAARIAKKGKATAIFASGLQLVVGAKEAVERSGLSIPEDISLIGFDDSYLAANVTPSLTTVFQPIWDIGRIGVEKIIELVRKDDKKPLNIVLDTKLVVRESSGRCRMP